MISSLCHAVHMNYEGRKYCTCEWRWSPFSYLKSGCYLNFAHANRICVGRTFKTSAYIAVI